DCRPTLGDTCMVCPDRCDVYGAYNEVVARQGRGAGAAMELAQIFKPAEVPTEGLEAMKDKWATTSNPKAKTITVEGPGSTTSAKGASAQAGKASTPAPARRKLSKKEVEELTARLEPKYREWLETVSMIIAAQEKEVFLQITDNYQKDRFIENFWKRRSIDGQGLRTDFQRVYIERVQYAREQFKNLNNDRAKIFVMNGPPDSVIVIDCDDVYVPIQIWYYERLEALKSKVYLIFYRRMGIEDYKLWTPIDGVAILQAGNVGGVLGSAPGAPRGGVDPRARGRTGPQGDSPPTPVLRSGAPPAGRGLP